VAFAVVFLISHLADLNSHDFLRSFILRVLADKLNKKKREFNFHPLHEGTEAGYGFAENQVLDLEGAFVGVERFRIGKEPGKRCSLRSMPLPPKSSRAHATVSRHLGGGERLRERGMRVCQLALGLQLAHAKTRGIATL